MSVCREAAATSKRGEEGRAESKVFLNVAVFYS